MRQKGDTGALCLLNAPNEDLKQRKNHNVFKRKLMQISYIINFLPFIHRFYIFINLFQVNKVSFHFISISLQCFFEIPIRQ